MVRARFHTVSAVSFHTVLANSRHTPLRAKTVGKLVNVIPRATSLLMRAQPMLSGPTTARDSFGGPRVEPAPDQRPLTG
jgi:hypothetical protein